MNEIPEWLTRQAASAPRALAVICGDNSWSFSELEAHAWGLAARLRQQGVGAGDRVAVLMGNGLPMVAVVHALIKLRAILVPLNTRLTATEIAWQLVDVGAVFVLHDSRHAALATSSQLAARDLPGMAIDGADLAIGDAVAAHDAPGEATVDLDATHAIIYTSGTTGRPKGVLLTYGNHWWNALGSALNLGLRDDDRWLAVLPLFHIGGLAILLRGVIYGIPVVIHERFDPGSVNHALDHGRVTIVSLVATMLDRMLRERGDQPYPPSLRTVLLGGGPAPLALLERCARLDVPVVQTYGMTETASQAATLSPAEALSRLGSAGRPLAHLQLRISVDEEAAPVGTVGEIVLRGPSVTPGYADRPQATAAAWRNGWFHTGDLGYLDGDGFLYVVDRRDDLIISGGENIYPAEVEAVLLAHPAVADAAVVGLPHPDWGQSVAASIVLRPGLTISPEELGAFCRERLARYKVPARIDLRASLPRNAAGKLVRHAVREVWLADLHTNPL